MSSIFFWLGAFIAAGAFVIHAFVGHALFVKPLLVDKPLPPRMTALTYVCWHSVSVAFLGCALALGYVALVPSAVAVAFLVAFICAGMVLVFVAIGLRGYPVVMRPPAVYGCGAIALLSMAGILSA